MGNVGEETNKEIIDEIVTILNGITKTDLLIYLRRFIQQASKRWS